MARKTYYFNPETGDMQEFKPEPPPKLHYVQDDTIPAVKSMTNGRTYDSKSALRREYRSKGCHEVGNEYVGKPWKGLPQQPTSTVAILRELADKVYTK